MADKEFQKYRDAVVYAKQVASNLTLSVMVKRSPSGWTVSVSDSSRLIASKKSPATTKTQKRDRSEASKSRSQWQRSGRATSPKKQGAVKERSGRPYAPRPKVIQPAPKSNNRVGRLEVATQIGIPRDQLIALKVFYLGRGVANSPTKSAAVDLVQQELDSLSVSGSQRARFIFFNLLLAEICRGEPSSISYREIAFAASKENDSEIYEAYMKIVQETQKQSSVDALTGRNIESGQVESRSSLHSEDEFGVVRSWVVDNALVALQISWADLTAEEREFIDQTKLVDIIARDDLGLMTGAKCY